MTSTPQPAVPDDPEVPAPTRSSRAVARSLSRATTDRDASRRSQPGLIAALAADPATRLLLVDARGRIALDAPAIGANLPDDGLTPAAPHDRDASVWRSGRTASSDARPRLAPLTAADLDVTGLTCFYLGREQGTGTGDAAGAAWLAVVVPTDDVTSPTDAEGAGHPHPALSAVLDRYPLSALRAVGADLDAHDAGLATPASALAAWHARSGFCPLCGGRTQIVQAGWARRCTSCGALDFPRTDPAVIMAVTDDADRIVLVHGATWDHHRYSTVAGFVEAGEAAEAAVVREVAEETGLKVAGVEFVASQPWPFPRSLMLGYRARLAPGEHLARPDGAEVTDAVVLSRAELTDAIAAGTVVLPGPTSIARMLIEDWYGGPIG
ncbi:NAD(+) diphosphatase [Actinomyces glycerinitolerans]|uniref:NAD(+) diphosphatase n=1 Tax=Actinomyces glycerinitolerans TaxID=1892869 RepID=A0A1M4RV52_9ACTO|nr:NAD(+) diphosphatase [Actinomyces glycerinitolerans]SHE23811.1 nudix box signature [Actinomyces glycerinitolerans]